METLPALVPSQQELDVYMVMAKRAAESKFYQQLGGEAGVIAIMLYARELNVPAMTAISGGFHNIQGKIEMSARLMNMLIRRAGHMMQITHPSEDTCQIHGKRIDTGEEYTATYSIEDAKAAGIFKQGGGWTKHKEDMLFARAISRLARRLFPDVIGTAYVEGEISDTHKKASAPERARLNIVDLKPGNIEDHKEVTEVVGLPVDQDIIDHDTIVAAVVETLGGEIVEPKPTKSPKQRSAEEALAAFKKYCIDKLGLNSVLVKEAADDLLIQDWGGTDVSTVPENLWKSFETWLKDTCLPEVTRRIEAYDELGGRE